MTSKYDRDDFTVENEDDEWLTRVVIDTCARRFYLYSSEGDTKIVDADNMDEFMNVLEIVRAVCTEDIVSYSEPIVAE